MKEKNEYDLQAEKFLSDTNTEFKAVFIENGRHFDDDKESRDVYDITLTRGGRSYVFRFGQSISSTGLRPTAYDVLACLTKYDPGDFAEFCSSYGYCDDSRKAEKTYKAVLDEWQNVRILWADEEIERLQEIQ